MKKHFFQTLPEVTGFDRNRSKMDTDIDFTAMQDRY